ncbi:Protein of unknown function DUF3716 [Penicillium italicum]|uniref:Uncharacterized protein n=1 Tax=Penicillium italicum TaxID=40296 RepID=A0A0A2LB59_PENIT|nr:Protein of unknown function DUF3716 [Penicillium italicum]
MQIIALPPVRDLDWRFGKKVHLTYEKKRRAALGQRSGKVALPGQECERCIRQRGPFNSCVVSQPQGLGAALFSGSCMNCAFTGSSNKCSFRGPGAPEWHIQWIRANEISSSIQPYNFVDFEGPISMSAHTGVPFLVDEGSAPSTPTRSKQHGPVYSAKWYRTPLDDRSLAKDTNGIIAVREDLRDVRARVAYDIKKLSKFAGDGGSEEETLEDDDPNPFYDSDSEPGDDDAGSTNARFENDGSEVGSLGVGSVDLNSDVVDSVVDSGDVDDDE